MFPRTTRDASVIIFFLLLELTHAAPRVNEAGSGQSWRFREAVIRAQCEATCLSKYGEQPVVDPLWIAIYDIYVPLTCSADGPCSQCLNPCRYIFGSLEQCYTTCADQPCRQSCDNVYSLWGQEQRTHTVAQSEDRIHVTPPTVTCQTLRQFPETAAGTYVYVKWDVMEGQQPAQSLPLSFVTEVQTKVNGSQTSWVPYSGNHAWVPVGVNWSTPYHFRVTPVRRDGVAGPPQTSKWITTLSGRTELLPPRSVKISKQDLIEGQVFVTFDWDQEEDVLPCHYELNLLPDSGTINSVSTSIALVPQSRYQYGPLPFGTSFTAKLSSCTGDGRCSDAAVSTHFSTVGCLEANDYSYLLCEPEKPHNLHVTNLLGYPNPGNTSKTDCLAEVEIHWSEPKHASATNEILGYKLTWNKVPDFWLSHLTKPHGKEIKISEKLTSYKIMGLHLSSRYLIHLRTLSVGGESLSVSTYVNTTVNNTLCAKTTGDFLGSTGDGKEEDKSHTLSLIIVSVAVVSAILIIITVFLRWKRRPVKRKFSKSMFQQDHMTGNPLYHSMKSINHEGPNRSGSLSGEPYEIDPRNLSLEEVVGQGAFGKVVKGYLKVIPKAIKGCKSAPLLVAVKLLKDYAGPSELDSLRQEIELMKGLGRHPNIVSMVACVTRGPHLCLVMDFCHHGDLRAYLRNLRLKYAPLMRCYRGVYSGSTRTSSATMTNSKDTINTDVTDAIIDVPNDVIRGKDFPGRPTSKGDCDSLSGLYVGESRTAPDSVSDCLPEDVDISIVRLLSFARQITVGMEYLAQKKFIHRDLAARNVLVCEDGLLKISDFGLTRDIYENNCYRKKGDGKLPIKWMSVEAIFDQVYTTPSDVWSFGIVLWEIVTLGGSPYPGILSSDLYRMLKEGYRMEKPDGCSDELYEVMLSCWRTLPDDRPTFTDLRRHLEKMLEESAEDDDNSYLNLDLEDAAANPQGPPTSCPNDHQSTPLGDSDSISNSSLVTEGTSSSDLDTGAAPDDSNTGAGQNQRTPHPLLRFITSRSDSEPLLAQLDRSLQHQHPRRQNFYSQLGSGGKPQRQRLLSGSLGNICHQKTIVEIRSDSWVPSPGVGQAQHGGNGGNERQKLSSAQRQESLLNNLQQRNIEIKLKDEIITIETPSRLLEEKDNSVKPLHKSRLTEKTQELIKCYLNAGPVGSASCEPSSEDFLAVVRSETSAAESRL